MQPGWRARVGEIGGQAGDVDAVSFAQLRGECLEPLGATCGEHEAAAARGQLAREFGADAGGCAGDQGMQ